jgi:hypothetical protein
LARYERKREREKREGGREAGERGVLRKKGQVRGGTEKRGKLRGK